MKAVFLSFGAMMLVALVLALVLFGVYATANNKETSVRAAFDAQQKLLEASFDRTWKVISQQVQVAEKERDSFKATYMEIMTATKGVAGEGKLASFFTQAKVDVSPALFQQLMTTIEAQRESFFREQKDLLDLQREHTRIRNHALYGLFVGGRPAVEAKIVTSAKTDAVFASGQDNDVQLFSK